MQGSTGRAQTARGEFGVGGTIVAALLAASQLNLVSGVPVYLGIAALTSQPFIPRSSAEIVVLAACLAPVTLFVLWTSFTKPLAEERPETEELSAGEQEFLRRMDRGEFDDELDEMARIIVGGSDLTDDQRAFRDSVEAYSDATARAAQELIEQLPPMDPQRAFEIAEQSAGHAAVAMRVRKLMWERNVIALDDQGFEAEAARVEAEDALHVDFKLRMIVIDAERERRGLPQPELPSADQAFATSSMLNARIAAGELDRATRVAAGRAEAVWAMAEAREERQQRRSD